MLLGSALGSLTCDRRAKGKRMHAEDVFQIAIFQKPGFLEEARYSGVISENSRLPKKR